MWSTQTNAVLSQVYSLSISVYIYIYIHPPSLRPSCCRGRFCRRRVELFPPPYSHAQTDVYSEQQVNNKSIKTLSQDLTSLNWLLLVSTFEHKEKKKKKRPLTDSSCFQELSMCCCARRPSWKCCNKNTNWSPLQSNWSALNIPMTPSSPAGTFIVKGCVCVCSSSVN